jgi:hypothetical protein
MIHQIDTTDNIVAFRALASVTKEDFQTVVVPAVEKLVRQIDEINFLLVLDTDLENFSAGAWLQDAMLGIKSKIWVNGTEPPSFLIRKKSSPLQTVLVM